MSYKMATVIMQKEHVVAWKKRTFMNLEVLSYTKAMPPELSRQIFKENALEKPTQNVFNHLTHYLLHIIDSNFCATMSWPLYDTKAERAYRNELSKFITDYSSKGMLSNVISSYLVNPGCYKVTKLIYQLSQLAVQKQLTSKMNENQRLLYNQVTERYKSDDREAFIDYIEKETQNIRSKFSKYTEKREAMEKIAAILRKKITDIETKLSTTKAQEFLNNTVDKFVAKHSPSLDNKTKTEILKIKDIQTDSAIFDDYLLETDQQIADLESKWDEKITPFLTICQTTKSRSEQLISRHMGQEDKSSYMIEYNHKTDEINTKELQKQVNSEQKYVLINLVKDEKLNFPNLIRSFVISMCYILKNSGGSNDIDKFSEYLSGRRKDYGEVVGAMSALLDRVMVAEAKLYSSPARYNNSSFDDLPDIPPLPDLTELCNIRDLQRQTLCDTFTPLSISKHQFNLNRKTNTYSFTKPQFKPLTTPFHPPREDFHRILKSCRTTSFDRHNVSQNFHNISIIPQSTKSNETIAECGGFTKQQIQRLLSTKKLSSTKKSYKTERGNINIRKGALFDESSTSNESNGLFRSHSSPNLFERGDKKSTGRRKLSIMHEANGSTLEVSGISVLGSDSDYNTPKNTDLGSNSDFKTPKNTELCNNSDFKTPKNTDSLKPVNTINVPSIIITPDHNKPFQDAIKDFKVDLDKDLIIESPKPSPILPIVQETKTETPKNPIPVIKKTSSLEKIINRFKKVKANVLNDTRIDFHQTIAEEKENYSANRVLLPDLLSPSCSVFSHKSNEDFDQIYLDIEEKVGRKPRESLGTALGVDQTFLDQFDLID